jgi:hypothetical protein
VVVPFEGSVPAFPSPSILSRSAGNKLGTELVEKSRCGCGLLVDLMLITSCLESCRRLIKIYYYD